MARIMQEAMVAAVLLLLCIYTAPSFQAPTTTNDAQPLSLDEEVNAVETARKLLSDAKKLHRKLRRRSTEGNSVNEGSDSSYAQPSPSSEQSGSPNVTAPKYILELYRNLSNTESLEATQANTIRSLQTISKAPRCGQYNFSLAALNSGEFIIKAELHVYMHKTSPRVSEQGPIVVLEKYRGHHDPEFVTSIIPTNQGEGWQVFQIQHVIQAWVDNKDSHSSRKIGFRLSVYANFQAFKNKSPQKCEEAQLQFVYSSKEKDAEHEPLLVIYSYDPTIEEVNYESILNELSTDATPTTTVDQGTESPTNAQRKRNVVGQATVSQARGCQVRELLITKEHLNNINYISNGKIILPNQFNASICGGTCSNRFPQGASPHAALVHLLLHMRVFTGLNYNNYQQICSPVRYVPVEFLVQRTDGVFEIQLRHKLKIAKCDCLEVYKTS